MGKSAEDGFLGGGTEGSQLSAMSQHWETGSEAEYAIKLLAYFLS
ncbi:MULTISPECIES: hypothetical protein [Photobacterium]|nr:MULTISPECIES: hypothetical protein [Photobacterium]MDO6579806.1 hypothetical protein [Photobacterium sp. 2_MG-2023]